MIKKLGILAMVVLALVFMSCGRDAKKAIDDAQLALNSAKDAGAQQYAPDEYKSAEGLLSKARDEYSAREYKSAETDALSAKDQAELAKKRALERKEEAEKSAQPSTLAYNVPSISEEGVPIEEQVKAALKDVSFEFDSAELDETAKQILVNNAKWLKDNSGVKIQIEGHCDERGSEEYNLALGNKRALAVRDYLVSLGVSPKQLSTISYGESMPLDTGHGETAWAKNRRAHFAIQK